MDLLDNNLIQNPYLQTLISCLMDKFIAFGFQGICELFRDKSSSGLLCKQLLQCLRESYRDTCDHFGWEWNESAIEDLLTDNKIFSSANGFWTGVVYILYQVSGAYETNIVNKEVEDFWRDRFNQNLACQQQLYNYLNQVPNRGISCPKMVGGDFIEYQNAFATPLFLESTVGDEKALLSDVYIPAKYKITTQIGEARGNFVEMLEAFFKGEKGFTVGQGIECDVIPFNQTFAILIMGKPGSGKSSFVSYLSTLLPEMAGHRPFYIVRLRNMSASEINSEDPIQGLLEYIGIDKNSLLNSIMILDGLDEVCALYRRTNFQLYLRRLLKDFERINGLKLVITSRTGYFRMDNVLAKYCLTLNIENWDNDDLELWSKKYGEKHPGLKSIIKKNCDHLKSEKYSDKKAIFAVPILFYMANARKELLEKHENICSIYDAVLTEVTDKRDYDSNQYYLVSDIIPQNLARQICIEIAFSMFRCGRLNYIEQSDPYLAPDEVENALSDAMRKCATDISLLEDAEKRKIREIYALTFYYNKSDSSHNAVEFAHKSIAEYFTSEKILEKICSISNKMSEDELVEVLTECFGYAPVTADILRFLDYRVKMLANTPKLSNIKVAMEKHFSNCVLDGKLFTQPRSYTSMMHCIDRIPVMLKSVLMLFEYLDCIPPELNEQEKTVFNNVIASVSRITSINSQNQSLIPFALNGFNLSDGNFEGAELSEVHMSGANLTHTVFTDANLIDGSLSRCIVNVADFSGANLAGAELLQIEGGEVVDFTEASLQGADFRESKFTNTSFDYAEMQDADLRDCVFGEGCHFCGTKLYLAKFDGADISRASIEDAVFEDEENMEDDVYSIAQLTLTRGQYEYIQSFEQVELINCIIVQ